MTYFKDLDNQTFSLMTLINVILWGGLVVPGACPGAVVDIDKMFETEMVIGDFNATEELIIL